jgi:hypothetical protein
MAFKAVVEELMSLNLFLLAAPAVVFITAIVVDSTPLDFHLVFLLTDRLQDIVVSAELLFKLLYLSKFSLVLRL